MLAQPKQIKQRNIQISEKTKYQSLQERIDAFGEPITHSKEVDFGTPTGAEIW